MKALLIDPMTISEREWQGRVTDLAAVLGWRWAHFRPAKTAKGWRTAMEGSPGFPDLVLVRPPRLVLAELKAQRNKPSADQEAWLEAFGQVPGIEAYVWHPRDWDAVIDCLTRRAA